MLVPLIMGFLLSVRLDGLYNCGCVYVSVIEKPQRLGLLRSWDPQGSLGCGNFVYSLSVEDKGKPRTDIFNEILPDCGDA